MSTLTFNVLFEQAQSGQSTLTECHSVGFLFLKEPVTASLSSPPAEKVSQSQQCVVVQRRSSLTPSFLPLFVCTQRVLSRQEELKERARLLLEQARRDAAMKAGSKSATTANTSGRAANACDVSTVRVLARLCVAMERESGLGPLIK